MNNHHHHHHEEFESEIESILNKILKEGTKDLVNNLGIIEKLLVQYRRNTTNALLRHIDQKAQDYGTYLLAAYSETRDLKKSIEILNS